MGLPAQVKAWLRGARRLSLWVLIGALSCGAAEVAAAQSVAYPQTSSVDANGVNLVSGQLQLATRDVSIGRSGAGQLTYARTLNITGAAGVQSNPVWRDNLSDGISTPDSVNYTVVFHNVTDNFTLSSGVFTSNQGYGTSLSYNSGTGVYTYTTRMGTVVTYSTAALAPVVVPSSTLVASITGVTYPSGAADTYTYETVNLCAPGGGSCGNYSRLQSLTNNFGYQLKLSYSLNGPSTTSDVAAWQTLSSIAAINNAVDYCNPAADTCSGFSTTWPSATYSSTTSSGTVTETITDAVGRASQLTMAPQNGSTINYVTQIQPPWSGHNATTVTYNTSNQVASVSNGVGTWTYSYSTSSGTQTTTITDPLSHQSVVVANLSTGLITSVTDALSHPTSFTYDSNGRMTQVTKPSGIEVQYTYDGRGNVTQTTAVPVSGSGLSNISTSASFDTTCTVQVKCNKPNSTTDANGNTTSYTYDSTIGALLTLTKPAPTTGAVQPKWTMAYTQVYAWYKNSGGSVVQAASPVSLLTSTSTCQTTASCSGTSDQVLSTVTYGTSGSANNLNATSVAKGAGDGSLTATSSATYDSFGNKATVTPPLGSSQTSGYFYDADHELIGETGPNPGGSLSNRSVRFTYNADGQVTETEKGTAASTSYSDFLSFTSLEQYATTYDAVGRTTVKTMASGGTTQHVSQYAYDNAGRVTCVAARINPSTFGSEPSSACTQGTILGSAHDRITAYAYDNANEVTQATEAYNTLSATTAWTKTYTSDGLTATILDASSNLTSYTYDGLDRGAQVNFPMPTTASNASNASDYEAVTFDANGNVVTDRKRDGTTLSYSYDALNRPTQKAVPGGSTTVNYVYDLLNRRTSATYASGGQAVSYTYDALNRLASETSASLTMSYQHDLDGNLTQMTWPDGFYAQYAYDALNRMSTIQDSSGGYTGSYLTYSYDNLGRRTQIARGNSTSTTYAYDGADRLTGLTQNLSGTGAVTYGLAYNAVNQVVSQGINNSAYMSHPGNQSISYTPNGLNQYASVSGTSFTYDSKGNLTYDGTRTFGYDVENRLTSESGGPQSATLSYDPLGRLYETVGSSTSQFVFAGDKLVAEYDGAGHVLRRYVIGSGLDSPVIWYEGSGFTNRNWLHTDNQGSVIADTNATGVVQSAYGYGPYGEPNAWSGSRYRYTGQIEIPEAGLYYYKARVYDPAYGRFPQTDPTGYGDGPNAYHYTHNDPMSRRDPRGTASIDVGAVAASGDDSGDIPYEDLTNPDIQADETDVLYDCGCTGGGAGAGAGADDGTGVALDGSSGGSGSICDSTGTLCVPDTASVGDGASLGYSTVSGGEGYSSWYIQWGLSQASTSGGWIVQNINAIGMDGTIATYWEAWQVYPGSQYTSLSGLSSYDDGFAGWPDGTQVTAMASFYEGLSLPSSFIPDNPETAAGILPSTTANPSFSTSAGTLPVVRVWTSLGLPMN